MFDVPLMIPIAVWAALILTAVWMVQLWNRLVTLVEARDDGTMRARGWPDWSPRWTLWPLNMRHRAIGRVQMRVLLFGVPLAEQDTQIAGAATRFRAVGFCLFGGLVICMMFVAYWQIGGPGPFIAAALFGGVVGLSLLVNWRDCGPWWPLTDGERE